MCPRDSLLCGAYAWPRPCNVTFLFARSWVHAPSTRIVLLPQTPGFGHVENVTSSSRAIVHLNAVQTALPILAPEKWSGSGPAPGTFTMQCSWAAQVAANFSTPCLCHGAADRGSATCCSEALLLFPAPSPFAWPPCRTARFLSFSGLSLLRDREAAEGHCQPCSWNCCHALTGLHHSHTVSAPAKIVPCASCIAQDFCFAITRTDRATWAQPEGAAACCPGLRLHIRTGCRSLAAAPRHFLRHTTGRASAPASVPPDRALPGSS